MNLEAQLAKLQTVLKVVESLDTGASVKQIMTLSQAYANDAVHFMEKGEREDAIEAFGIAWAYLDALLHLGKIKVPEQFLAWFTVE
ncbi:MAG: DUF357 domain-containing protein [Candidatus Altiarchaeota archaeon]|nr:DUF357 domain-containing protein [Candidatus Altiarchaeota archaeon]